MAMGAFRYFRAILFVGFILGYSMLSAQNWRTHFDNARNFFDKQDYRNAADHFRKSREAAISLSGESTRLVSSINIWLADCLAATGDENEIVSLLIQAKNIREVKFGKETVDYLLAHNKLGMHYFNTRKFTNCKPLFEEEVALRAKVEGREHANYALAVNNLATLYSEMKRWDQAESLFREAIEIREKVFGPDHLQYAASVEGLALQFHELKRFREAAPMFQELHEIYLKQLGRSSAAYRYNVNKLGFAYKAIGDYEKALKYYEEDVRVTGLYVGKSSKEYAIALSNLGNLYSDLGKYEKAKGMLIQAVALKRLTHGTNDPSYATSVNNLASYYDRVGNHDQALELYEESLEIKRRTLGVNSESYALAINNIAHLYSNQGRLNEAEEKFNEAVQIFQRTSGESREYAQALANLGDLYSDLGLLSKASDTLRKALTLQRRILGDKHPEVATTINNLAVLEKEQGRFPVTLLKEALDIKASTLGKDHSSYLRSASNLAFTYEAFGFVKKAEKMYLEIKEKQRSTLGPIHEDYATTINNLAVLYYRNEELERAKPYYEEMLNILERKVGKNHPNYNTGKFNLGLLYDAMGLHEKAEPLLVQPCNYLIRTLNEKVTSLSEKERAEMYHSLENSLEIFNSFAIRRFEEKPALLGENLNLILATKGLLFNSSEIIRNRVRNSRDPALKKAYDDWLEQRKYLAKIYTLPAREIKDREVDVTFEENKANHLESVLSSKSEWLAGSLSDTTQTKWEQIREKLHSNEAAIEIVRFEYHHKEWTDSIMYLAMIVTPETGMNPDLVVLPNGKLMEGPWLKGYRAAIKYKLDDARSYDLFWRPIAERLPDGVKKVYVSGDGVYHSISLAGLHNKIEDRYLQDELEIQLTTSTRDLVKPKRTRKLNQKVFLYGYPDYNASLNSKNVPALDNIRREMATDTAQRFFSGELITELPGTKREVENLWSIVESANLEPAVRLGNEATETSIKEISNPRVLHIATHGFFLKDEQRPKQNGLVMGVETSRVYQNPLLRSGLLFANARQAISEGGDGILTSYEAMNLELDETELVALSACETGLGTIQNGEGVFGLQWAFQSAGASNVLMSLWTVSDDATQKLMTSFYRNWLTGNMDKRLAFKTAQNELREEYPEPYYWAAFVLIGD